jgi:signal transduction histidine kinase
MPRQEYGGSPVPADARHRLVVFDRGGDGSAEVIATLEAHGYQVDREDLRAASTPFFRQEQPALAIWADSGEGPPAHLARLHAAAHQAGILSLDVVETAPDPSSWGEPHEAADDWVSRGSVRTELPARVARLLDARRSAPPAAPSLPGPAKCVDERFVALLVHDLRTPLNVIGLSLRMIGQAIPKGSPDLDEDLRFVEENFKQIERMLTQLSDYSRLFHASDQGLVYEFSPRQLTSELLEDLASRASPRSLPVRFAVEESCPQEAALDPIRARMAIRYAIENAVASAKEGPIRVTLRGRPDRWVVEVGVDVPPPSSVKATELRTDTFERICGTAAERRGIDLAIAARVSELFGGTARLDVDEDRGTSVVLDWPVRVAAPPSGVDATARPR